MYNPPVIIKTGSFANWITAAAAVATFATVAYTAVHVLEELDKIEQLKDKVVESVKPKSIMKRIVRRGK